VYLLLLPISMAVSAGIVTLILNLGLVSYAMKVSRLERAGVGSIFDGFDVFFRALWMNICRGFMVFVWSLPVVLVSALVVFLAYTESEEFIYALYLLSPLLCVVTTIVGLKYSMTPYLLFDHPEWSAIRCMRESNSLMKGHKWSLFVLRLSFIGWVFLSAIPFVSLYTIPFMGITEAVFYAQLTSPETEDEDKKLTQETVGVPVISIGVPTVVDSSTLVYDALQLAKIDETDDSLQKVLENGRSFFVSPKECDVIVSHFSKLISKAIELAYVGELPF